MERKYYEAYDDRYRQIHSMDLQWSHNEPTPIVMETIREFGIRREQPILELGCGEGRDAALLLREGYGLIATDISAEVIRYDREKWPEFSERFSVLDCVAGELPDRFDFIYAVAVVHMLVEEEDRARFYGFIREHLEAGGIALICTMGDGKIQRQSDIRTAFDLLPRVHQQTGKEVRIAGTSCRMVDFETFRAELRRNGLAIRKEGITAAPPGFPVLMYAVVERDPSWG